jgi:hypothetical protein
LSILAPLRAQQNVFGGRRGVFSWSQSTCFAR